MNTYIYKNKNTGVIKKTSKKVDDNDWKLVRVMKDGRMDPSKIVRKPF